MKAPVYQARGFSACWTHVSVFQKAWKGIDMHMPTRYIGRWGGEISDVTRMNKYDGEIVLGLGEVSTTYFMAQGKQEGELDLQCVADGFLVVKETAGSFEGTLLLYLDADSNLKCVWRSGSRFNSEATMTRIEPA